MVKPKFNLKSSSNLMKKIYLQKLSLNNFKGIKSLTIDFEKDLNDIFGDNGTGKTTVFDGFTWLLFGKDHNDNTKFEIKTLNANNKAIPKLEHEVEAILIINGDRTIIRKCYKEKWTKQRGSTETVLTGHEISYFINNVPLSSAEFNSEISKIVDERAFKLLTNPFYFNSLQWSSRREILTKIANIATDEEIASENIDFVKLLQELSGKSLEKFKLEINASKKLLKSEIEEIPTRIDELFKSLPVSQDWEKIRTDIASKNAEIETIVSQIIDSSKVGEEQSSKINEKQQNVMLCENKKSSIEQEVNRQINNLKTTYLSSINEHNQKVQKSEYDLQHVSKKIEFEYSEKRSLETELAKLRQEFDKRQSEQLVYDEHKFSCPTCSREFEPYQIETMKAEMQTNFNTAKASDLEAININGKKAKDKLEKTHQTIKELEAEKESLENKVTTLKQQLAEFQEAPKVSLEEMLSNNAEYQKAVQDVEKAKQEVEAVRNEVVHKDIDLINSLEVRKLNLKSEVDSLTKTLFQEEQIKHGNSRIETLNERNQDLSQQLADLENKEFTMEKFIAEKTNRIERAVNSMFPTVKFKMFLEQLNGGIAECCETLVNGVPFDNANNASKIHSGVEIINVLSEYYECIAPIFIDNAESVVKVPFTNSQLIRLIVSENHKCLTVKK